jgi:hypothetical protein
MKSTAVVTYRMRGSNVINTNKYDLTNPHEYTNYESFIDSIRAHEIGEGMDAVVVAGKADYFVTSFE